MTTAANKDRVPTHELCAVILSKLQMHSCTAGELADMIGYNITTIRKRLEVLEERKLVHRIDHKNATNSGTTFTWHAGLAPDAVAGPVPDSDPIEVPRRFFATSFPPVGRRDPLVAALFGAPGVRP